MTKKERDKTANELIKKGIIPIGDEINTKTAWNKRGYRIDEQYINRPVYTINELFSFYGRSFRKKVDYYATYQMIKKNYLEDIIDQKYIKIKSELYVMLIEFFINKIGDERTEDTITEMLKENEEKREKRK